MKRYTITILERDYRRLLEVLAAYPGVENAAYLLCRMSASQEEARLLVREVVPVERHHLLEMSLSHMKIASASFRKAMKRSHELGGSFVFVHTHPAGHPHHSPQDDREEAPLFRTAYNRIRGAGTHASLVFSGGRVSGARVWLEDGTTKPIERIRIIGKRFEFWFADHDETPIAEFYDRQVRAFGADLQRVLARLHVGVVGAGGTGSAVIQQLTRLGVGRLTIADGQTFDVSNINRLHGSRVVDRDIPKVKIAERGIADMGLGTDVQLLGKSISYRSALETLKDCDCIFGCTDEELGRSLLTRLAVYYGLPVFDMGVKIDSADGTIRSIQGRVTTLLPGAACLFCRGRISAELVGVDSTRETNPELAEDLARQGYAPELEDPSPAVVPFTTAIASSAVSELLHRLTGFMGADHESSELIYLFDVPAIRRNSKPSASECFCAPREKWMRGDTRPFLDTSWRSE